MQYTIVTLCNDTVPNKNETMPPHFGTTYSWLTSSMTHDSQTCQPQSIKTQTRQPSLRNCNYLCALGGRKIGQQQFFQYAVSSIYRPTDRRTGTWLHVYISSLHDPDHIPSLILVAGDTCPMIESICPSETLEAHKNWNCMHTNV